MLEKKQIAYDFNAYLFDWPCRMRGKRSDKGCPEGGEIDARAGGRFHPRSQRGSRQRACCCASPNGWLQGSADAQQAGRSRHVKGSGRPNSG